MVDIPKDQQGPYAKQVEDLRSSICNVEDDDKAIERYQTVVALAQTLYPDHTTNTGHAIYHALIGSSIPSFEDPVMTTDEYDEVMKRLTQIRDDLQKK